MEIEEKEKKRECKELCEKKKWEENERWIRVVEGVKTES